MAKKREKTRDTAETPPREAGVPGWIPGGGVMVLGALIFLSGRAPFFSSDTGEWLRMGGIILAVIGLIVGTSGRITLQSSLDWAKSLAIAIGIALVVRWAVFEPYRIPSGSMEPTLMGDPAFMRGDRVFVNKWVYGLRVPFQNARLWQGAEPQRWELVVFKTVEENALHGTLVKRIVGMPGEHLQIRDGKVFVNGEALELPPDMPQDTHYTAPPFTDMRYGIRPEPEYSQIPPGQYLLLGDNSADSRDGRVFGWVPGDHFVGRVSCIAWPIAHWRDFTGFSKTWWWRGTLALIAGLTLFRIFAGRSWAVRAGKTGRVDHLLIGFWPFGLRLPLSGLWAMRWGRPRRGDLVYYLAADPGGDAASHHLGRVLALPGEKLTRDGDGLRLGDAPLTLPAPLESAVSKLDAQGNGKGRGQFKAPEDGYFILAEDPSEPDAADSRALGPVHESRILGRAIAVWWPVWRARRIP